ncbi:MAG: glycosyltransferase [Gammaproteobacteria bacterium]|nr:glycosyltransferase [Gammaproteobacteria bacterium]
MKVCQVMGGSDDGGLETHFMDLANGLAALGDEVVAIGHSRYRDGFDDTVHFAPLNLARNRRDPFLRRGLRRLIEANAPAIVHAQGGKAADLIAAIRPSARVVGTIHNKKSNLTSYLGFDAVIGVSRGVVADLRHDNKHVVYNGVHPPSSSLSAAELRQRFAIPDDEKLTLAIGRLVPAKAFHRLIEIWDDTMGRLLIVGEGPERRRLEPLAEGKPVILAGFQANARSMMTGADLMVFASEREGFSYAMVEALQARLPIVSTPVPGAAELLPPTHLASAGNLKSAIKECLGDPDAARVRMDRLFQWAAQTLTVDKMVEATRDVYLGITR